MMLRARWHPCFQYFQGVTAGKGDGVPPRLIRVFIRLAMVHEESRAGICYASTALLKLDEGTTTRAWRVPLLSSEAPGGGARIVFPFAE
jgi:hypothetical protein